MEPIHVSCFLSMLQHASQTEPIKYGTKTFFILSPFLDLLRVVLALENLYI